MSSEREPSAREKIADAVIGFAVGAIIAIGLAVIFANVLY